MRIVMSKELSSYKILPFDLYNEMSQKILGAGEVLTPGKLIMLKNYPKIFTEEFSSEPIKGDKNSSSKTSLKKLAGFSYDTLEINDFETVTNRDNVLKSELQVKIKYYFKKTQDLFMLGYYEEGVLKLNSLVSIIMSDIFKQLSKSRKGSQVRFLGEYEICHPLNVAIISGLIAKKMEMPNPVVEQVIMAGLLHDIGKFLIKLEDGNSALLTVNEDEVMEHTTLGYDLIKNKLHLSEEIAIAALEHHENNDGSGYPQGFSSDTISEFAQIVNVANYYDNLAYNRTANSITSNREALRVMLEIGTKRFSAQMLYTFIHMFNYDDSREFNDMIL